MVNFPAYLTRLELVPLCLQTQHSVRESSGFFFFSGGSMLLRPGRLPLFAAGAELSSNFGFCENQPQILISKRPQINAQVFWGICLRWTRSCIKHCISKWTEVYRGRYGWVRARERWSESCLLIGYPSHGCHSQRFLKFPDFSLRTANFPDQMN